MTTPVDDPRDKIELHPEVDRTPTPDPDPDGMVVPVAVDPVMPV